VKGVDVSRGRQTHVVGNVDSRKVERDIGWMNNRQEVVIVYIPQVLMMLL
jgi:hypothetical protein